MNKIKLAFIPLICICLFCMPKCTNRSPLLSGNESKNIIPMISNLTNYLCNYLKYDSCFVNKKEWDQLSEEQKNIINTHLEKTNRKIEIIEITNKLPQKENKPLIGFMIMKMSEKEDSIQIWFEESFGRHEGGGEIYMLIKKENEYFISKKISNIYH